MSLQSGEALFGGMHLLFFLLVKTIIRCLWLVLSFVTFVGLLSTWVTLKWCNMSSPLYLGEHGESIHHAGHYLLFQEKLNVFLSNLLLPLEAPKWQHLLFLSWYVQTLLHNYLDLATFNTKDLTLLLIPWPSRGSSGKYELVWTHNSSFSETMRYWPNIWLYIKTRPLVHFYVTERFSIDKCLSIACIFYGKIIAYPLHIIFQSCCMCSNCSKEWKVNMVKILP